MALTRRQALGLGSGAAALHLVPGGASGSFFDAALAQEAAQNPFAGSGLSPRFQSSSKEC